ncbi:MAG: hypothetical protein ACJ79L_12150 [Anaeromyxobacteraceae bacterium]
MSPAAATARSTPTASLAERRAAAAVLRWRARALVAGNAATALACRALPMLLQASFDTPPFDRDAPGVAGVRYHRRWLHLARTLRLPPPRRVHRGAPLFLALVALPARRGLDVLALVAPETAAGDRAVAAERIAAAERALRVGGVEARVELLDTAKLARDAATAARAMAFGALVAGDLPDDLWDALEDGPPLVGRAALAALAAAAPTPFSSLALTILARGAAPAPLAAMRDALAAGVTTRRAADVDEACARCAAGAEQGPLLATALELVRAPARGAESPGELDRALAIGRALALARARALRVVRCTVGGAAPRVHDDAFRAGVPSVLLPALGYRIAAYARRRSVAVAPVREGTTYAVRLPEGTLLARAAGPVQARVRALALLAAATGPSGAPSPAPWPADLDPAWCVLAGRLAQPIQAELLLVVEAGSAARPGPPFDPLNRGAERALEFEGALAVAIGRRSRPSARMLGARDTVLATLSHAARGAHPELLAARSEARPVAARLAQIAALVRDADAAQPVAIEAGGRVLLPGEPRPRSYPVRSFAARPRVYAPDPEAPDIAVSDEGRARWGSSTVVHCRVTRLGVDRAALLYADGAGGYLREEAALAEVEDHLADARGVLRSAAPPSIVTVRLADDLEPALRRLQRRGPRVEVTVAGVLPWIAVEVDGERFDGAFAWSDAAQAILARWPPQLEGRFGVAAVSARVRGEAPPPLLALWAASVARRRVRLHLERALAPYRVAATGRREG